MAKHTDLNYENNPFYIGYNGIRLFFQQAQSVAIYLIVVTVAASLIGFAVSIAGNLADDSPTAVNGPQQSSSLPWDGSTTPLEIALGVAIIIGVIAAFCFFFLAVSLLMFGVGDYAAAQLAAGRKTDLKTSFKAVLSQFPSYMWVYIIIVVKIALWSLLFIVPGIIMTFRYMLAGTVFFAEGKRGNAAVKRSAELTKGAWLTTYAGFNLWNFITQGMMTMVLVPGTYAVLYRQLSDATDSNIPKPAAHWLSWLTLLVPIVLSMIIMALLGLVLLLTFTLNAR